MIEISSSFFVSLGFHLRREEQEGDGSDKEAANNFVTSGVPKLLNRLEMECRE